MHTYMQKKILFSLAFFAHQSSNASFIEFERFREREREFFSHNFLLIYFSIHITWKLFTQAGKKNFYFNFTNINFYIDFFFSLPAYEFSFSFSFSLLLDFPHSYSILLIAKWELKMQKKKKGKTWGEKKGLKNFLNFLRDKKNDKNCFNQKKLCFCTLHTIYTFNFHTIILITIIIKR